MFDKFFIEGMLVVYLLFFVEELKEKGICCLKNLFIDLIFFDLLEYGEWGLRVDGLFDKLLGWFELFDVYLFFFD